MDQGFFTIFCLPLSLENCVLNYENSFLITHKTRQIGFLKSVNVCCLNYKDINLPSFVWQNEIVSTFSREHRNLVVTQSAHSHTRVYLLTDFIVSRDCGLLRYDPIYSGRCLPNFERMLSYDLYLQP